MERDELLSKLDLIEEQASLTLGDLPVRVAKERQRMIIALVKHIRWGILDSDPQLAQDPEATAGLPDVPLHS